MDTVGDIGNVLLDRPVSVGIHLVSGNHLDVQRDQVHLLDCAEQQLIGCKVRRRGGLEGDVIGPCFQPDQVLALFPLFTEPAHRNVVAGVRQRVALELRERHLTINVYVLEDRHLLLQSLDVAQADAVEPVSGHIETVGDRFAGRLPHILGQNINQ